MLRSAGGTVSHGYIWNSEFDGKKKEEDSKVACDSVWCDALVSSFFLLVTPAEVERGGKTSLKAAIDACMSNQSLPPRERCGCLRIPYRSILSLLELCLQLSLIRSNPTDWHKIIIIIQPPWIFLLMGSLLAVKDYFVATLCLCNCCELNLISTWHGIIVALCFYEELLPVRSHFSIP